jgi:hypothetical protein
MMIGRDPETQPISESEFEAELARERPAMVARFRQMGRDEADKAFNTAGRVDAINADTLREPFRQKIMAEIIDILEGPDTKKAVLLRGLLTAIAADRLTGEMLKAFVDRLAQLHLQSGEGHG